MQQGMKCLNCGTINDRNVPKCRQCGSPLVTGVTGELTNIRVQSRVDTQATITPLRLPKSGSFPPSPQLRRILPDLLSKYRWLLITLSVLIILVPVALTLQHLIWPPVPAVPTPTPLQLPDGLGVVKAPNGEYVGVNDGTFYSFDQKRVDPPGLRQQAMNALQPGGSGSGTAESLWSNYLTGNNTNDAEIQIYLQNQYVYTSHKKYVTLVVGVAFPGPQQSADPGAIASTRSILQGVYIAQEAFNNPQNAIQLRLLIVNTGDNQSYIKPVADQLAHIIRKDNTIVGIIGWPTSKITSPMLQALQHDDINIPMVSQTASSDYLTKNPPFNYFHIVSPNWSEAQLGLAAAKRLGATQAIIFKDQSDPYSQNLAQDLENLCPDAYIEEEFTVENTTTFAFSLKLKDALKKVQDPKHTVVFFTGILDYDVEQFQQALADNNNPAFPVISGNAGYVATPPAYGRWLFLTPFMMSIKRSWAVKRPSLRNTVTLLIPISAIPVGITPISLMLKR